MDELVTREDDDCPKCGRRVGDAANTCTLTDCPEWSDWRTGDQLVTRPEFAIHHPDDETLTVADALTRLLRDDHQRIAALVEWLAEELARKNCAIHQALHHLRERSDPSHRWPIEVEDARKALRDA